MSKPVFGGNKATLPSAIIRPGKYQPKKFQMEMPDEKQSGIYGLKKEDDDDVVESLALDDNIQRSGFKPIQGSKLNQNTSQSALGSLASGPPKVQPKLLGPNFMKQKIKENLADGGTRVRPPSSQ